MKIHETTPFVYIRLSFTAHLKRLESMKTRPRCRLVLLSIVPRLTAIPFGPVAAGLCILHHFLNGLEAKPGARTTSI